MNNKILFITSFPPRECGIATYSQDLIAAISNKFEYSDKILICSIESSLEQHNYPKEVDYILNTENVHSYFDLSEAINLNDEIGVVLIQHEFGFFKNNEVVFQAFLADIKKPIVIVFHTVLPNPDEALLNYIFDISEHSSRIIVMTKSSSSILKDQYFILSEKIEVIPHGTHLVPHKSKIELKEKYKLTGRKVLSTFGLLSSGKSIETTLFALPEIIKKFPDVLFLIIGKTHPTVFNTDGEVYRDYLKSVINANKLENHVKFINEFLPLPELLDYLQLTDIYLFTSKNPNQAVSGTFSYAVSCGCAIVSTPIPHAKEVLANDNDCIIDFEDSNMLANVVLRMLSDENYLKNSRNKGLHMMASTAWENTAIAHAQLFTELNPKEIDLNYKAPNINLLHIESLTTEYGIIQFSNINIPDKCSGYTLDDNARALVAMCQYYEISEDIKALYYIKLYYNFIKDCLQDEGDFFNYVDEEKKFTHQNYETNLEDANGRAIWALGYLSHTCIDFLPYGFIDDIEETLDKALQNVQQIYSSRAMAFIVKGLYYRSKFQSSTLTTELIKQLSNRLLKMYNHEATNDWKWFEPYLTYANSVLPEAMLCAYFVTKNDAYKKIAKESLDFLLSKIFVSNRISVVSNVNWLLRGNETNLIKNGGEQPIDVAYTIIALEKFNKVFPGEGYNFKLQSAFNWFLGYNHLKQTIYNPCTGGCYDGLEETSVNLNQGAESTISYLLARLTLERSSMHKKREQHFSTVLL